MMPQQKATSFQRHCNIRPYSDIEIDEKEEEIKMPEKRNKKKTTT